MPSDPLGLNKYLLPAPTFGVNNSPLPDDRDPLNKFIKDYREAPPRVKGKTPDYTRLRWSSRQQLNKSMGLPYDREVDESDGKPVFGGNAFAKPERAYGSPGMIDADYVPPASTMKPDEWEAFKHGDDLPPGQMNELRRQHNIPEVDEASRPAFASEEVLRKPTIYFHRPTDEAAKGVPAAPSESTQPRFSEIPEDVDPLKFPQFGYLEDLFTGGVRHAGNFLRKRIEEGPVNPTVPLNSPPPERSGQPRPKGVSLAHAQPQIAAAQDTLTPFAPTMFSQTPAPDSSSGDDPLGLNKYLKPPLAPPVQRETDEPSSIEEAQRMSTTYGPATQAERLARIRKFNPSMADDAEEFIKLARSSGFNPTIKSDVRDAPHEWILNKLGYPTKGHNGYNSISPHQIEDGARAIDWGLKGQPRAFQQLARDFAASHGYVIPSDEPWHWTQARGAGFTSKYPDPLGLTKYLTPATASATPALPSSPASASSSTPDDRARAVEIFSKNPSAAIPVSTLDEEGHPKFLDYAHNIEEWDKLNGTQTAPQAPAPSPVDEPPVQLDPANSDPLGLNKYLKPARGSAHVTSRVLDDVAEIPADYQSTEDEEERLIKLWASHTGGTRDAETATRLFVASNGLNALRDRFRRAGIPFEQPQPALPQVPGGEPYIPVALTLPKDQGQRWEDISPETLSRRAVFQFAASHNLPEEFTRSFLDREQEAGHLQPYDIQSGKAESTADILKDPRAFNPQSNTLTLKLRKSLTDKLLDEWEENKPTSTRIAEAGHILAEDWRNPQATPGTLAYDLADVGTQAVAPLARGATRMVQAASTGLNALTRAQAAGPLRLAGVETRNPLEILTGAPSAMWHELRTGETDPGYENPAGEVVDKWAGPTLARVNPSLPAFAKAVANVVGDPLTLIGAASALSKVGKVGRALSLGEDAAAIDSVESRLAQVADTIEQRTGVRPTLEVQPDNSIKVTSQFGMGEPVTFTIPPGGGEMRLPASSRSAAPTLEPVVFEHPEYGRVVKAENQGGVPPGFSRVVEEGTPEAERVVNDSKLTIAPDASQLTAAQKAGRLALNLYELPRAVKTAYGFHGPRSTLIASVVHPVRGAQGFVKGLEAFKSEEAANAVYQAMIDDPVMPLIKQTRLRFTHYDNPAAVEDFFRSDLAEHVPGVRASKRAYYANVNYVRFSLFKDYALAHPEASLEELNGISDALNYFTGYGSYGGVEKYKVVRGLARVFYAPRLKLSYPQAALSPLIVPTPAAKLYAARHVVQFVGTGLATASLVKMSAPHTGVDFQANPLASDFGHLKIGHERVNLFAGMSSLARTVAQSYAQQGKSSGEDEYYDKPLGKTLLGYGRAQLHPTLGFVIDLKTGETIDRRQLYNSDGSWSPWAAGRDALLPLSLGNILDAVKDDRDSGGGGLTGSAFAIPALTGFDVQTHNQPATGKQTTYIYQLARRANVNADRESKRLFNRPVEKLTDDDAGQLIEELKARRDYGESGRRESAGR